jgi:hypothetical protein
MTTATNHRTTKKDEAARPRDRERVKGQIAHCEAVLSRARAIEEQQRGLDLQSDEAVAEHEQACLPAQEAIQRIEQKMAVLIADRKPIPGELERQRLEALEQIEQANQALELRTQTLKKARGRLEKQASELHSQAANIQVLRNSLAKAPLANEKLLVDMHVARQATRWLSARVNAAAAQVDNWRAAVKDAKVNGTRPLVGNFGYEFRDGEPVTHAMLDAERLERWTAELEAAGAALQAAQRVENDLHQAMIDE